MPFRRSALPHAGIAAATVSLARRPNATTTAGHALVTRIAIDLLESIHRMNPAHDHRAVGATQFLHDGALALVDGFHTVAHGRFDVPNVLYETFEPARLDRGGLIGAPHGSIERDVPFDETRAKAH